MPQPPLGAQQGQSKRGKCSFAPRVCVQWLLLEVRFGLTCLVFFWDLQREEGVAAGDPHL